MQLRDYVRILRQYWRMIIVVILLAVGLSLAFTYTQSLAPAYEAKTRLFVAASAAKERDVSAIGQFSLQRVKSYVELVHGDELSRRVVQRFNLRETPRELASQISASAVPDTVILQISVTNPSADRARFLANAVAKEFAAFVRELETPPATTQSHVKATVIDSAADATRVGGPQPLRSLVVGLLLGPFIGFGLAIVRESVRSADVD